MAAGATSDSKPVLWQLSISHYNEKARWALDYKGVDHVRRSPLPGGHMAIALWLTRGASTLVPILQIDGETITDSTAIIAALEARYPEPPLYPADPELRRKALELEDYFDEQLGPAARLLAFHELINEPEIFAQVAAEAVPGPLGKMKKVTGIYASTYTSLRWKASSEEGAEEARAKIVAAMDVVDAELAAGDGEFLVGDSFSVADVTAASLFYPVVGPDEGPLPPGQPVPPNLERFREELSTRPAFNWVKETFRRHRHSHPPVSSAISG
ncbi:MAG TPA: glutathione S-transferase family protein [Solirubrobacterales bacterium]|nr:glutathione S-transferase family protein [Solirubrobacterales bacterium]